MRRQLLPDGSTIAFHTDITELKINEEELRNTEALLRDAIENIPGGFALLDSEDRFILFNDEFCFDRPPLIHHPKIGETFEKFITARDKLGILNIQSLGKTLSVEERFERHRNPTVPMEKEVDPGRK